MLAFCAFCVIYCLLFYGHIFFLGDTRSTVINRIYTRGRLRHLRRVRRLRGNKADALNVRRILKTSEVKCVQSAHLTDELVISDV